MQKEFEIFYQKDVVPALKKALKELEEIYQSRSRIEGERFQKQFKKLCLELKKYIDVDEFCPAFIYFNLLRSRLIKKNYEYAVYVYDKSCYMKDGLWIGNIDVSFLFQPYDSLWDELLTRSRKYIGKVSFDEVRNLMLSLSGRFHRYVVEFLRLQIGSAVEMEEYLSLKREKEVEIASGEFFEPCDLIYLENSEKRISKIRRRLQNPKVGELQFRDFRGMKLSEMLLNNCDFRYADFSDGKLEQVKFTSCLMDGVRFRRAKLEGANLMMSLIHDTDFEGADLSGAFLNFCISDQGLNPHNEWRNVGVLGSNFRNANLEGANFQNALIVGGDFTGANLNGARFDNASLFRSRFNQELVPEGVFTKEQQGQMIMV